MTQYARGRRLEWLVKEHFEKAGFLVVRSAGSLGVVDLVAVPKRDNPLALCVIQCKAYAFNGRKPKPSKSFLALKVRATKVWATKQDRRAFEMEFFPQEEKQK